MKKSAKAQAGQVFAGIDVSAHELSVGMRRGIEDRLAVTTFTNSAAGHKALLVFLLQGNARVRVCLEASGNYSLDLALTLQAHRQVEISVVNPRRARRFAESLGERNKTDRVDARVNMPLACPGCLGSHRVQLPCTCVLLHGPLRT